MVRPAPRRRFQSISRFALAALTATVLTITSSCTAIGGSAKTDFPAPEKPNLTVGMLPIVDTPTIQLVVEEAVAAGIEEIVLVNGRGKSSIEDHFDVAYELEDTLRRRDKQDLLAPIERISKMRRSPRSSMVVASGLSR